jgi:hypothetical protein
MRVYADLSPEHVTHRKEVVASTIPWLKDSIAQGSLIKPVEFFTGKVHWNKGFDDYEFGIRISERYPDLLLVTTNLARSAMLSVAMAGAQPATLEQVKVVDEYGMPISLQSEVDDVLGWAEDSDDGFNVDDFNGTKLPEASMYYSGGYVLKRDEGITAFLEQAYDVGCMARAWVISDGKFREKLNITEAVSDTYWRIVITVGYEADDEKHFFEDVFVAALEEVAKFTGKSFSSEQTCSLRAQIQSECHDVDQYGFDEKVIQVG